MDVEGIGLVIEIFGDGCVYITSTLLLLLNDKEDSVFSLSLEI